MILVAIGANLPADGYKSPVDTCVAAVERLSAEPGIDILSRSRWYESEPVPPSGQPWYINGVLIVRTSLAPRALLGRLHAIEATFGRVRRVRNEARPLDLDLIDYDGTVSDGGDGGPILPHPRAHERAFVLLPLSDVAPDWSHPVTGASVSDLIGALPAEGPAIRPLPSA